MSRLLFLSVFSLVFTLSVAQPRVVAHRGGAGLGLENTLSCIEKGIAAGADAVEIDVHLTKDGHIVVCHDATVDGVTDGNGKIAEMTLAQVRELNIIDSAGNVTGEHIPTLAQVIELVDGRCGLLIEVKRKRGSNKGIEYKLINEIVGRGATDWVAVQSFSDDVLETLFLLDAPFGLEKLIVFKIPLLPLIYDGSLRFFSFDKYDYISSFNFHRKCLPRNLAAKIRAAGKEIKVWTLDGRSDAPSATVDAVITDRPDLWK